MAAAGGRPAGGPLPFAELEMGSLSIEELLVVIQSRVGARGYAQR
ncbi:hypothetical protein [Streptomyces sp. JJ36]|nr:hypothetical protein [Streptomyces sp. JJ36]